MPIVFTIDNERRWVRIVATGEVTREEIFGYLDAVVAHRDYDPTFHEYVDATRLDPTHIHIDVIRAWNDKSGQLGVDARHRVAIVVSSDVTFGLVRQAELVKESTRVPMRAFRDADEAVAWLEEA